MRIVPKILILAFILALSLTSVVTAAGISGTASPVPAEWMSRQAPATQCDTAFRFADLMNATPSASVSTKTRSSTASLCPFVCTVGCVASGYFGGYCVGGSCFCNGADTR
jgi:hypothetical protein